MPGAAVLKRCVRALCLVGLVVSPNAASWAIVGGATEAPDLAPYVVMVLKRSGERSGFCSGAVIARTIVLTAGHCVGAAADLRIHFKAANGTPVLLPVAEVKTHPGYRADAVQSRQRSIDLALIRLAEPLPASFKPLDLGTDDVPLGMGVGLIGYGLARENDPTTGGTLREGRVIVRPPKSSILLWMADGSEKGTGACTGDSGGPVLSLDRQQLIAVIDWAAGGKATRCGSLTQATLVAPQRDWVQAVISSWTR